ncbi:GntR family transcriptional regulator [Secundilactobacillus silagincola]|uniref:GntR family transcriptional regulator n=1 Tax=Secundilactobacillus silagincola TaxID=1714681 RepID=A0A1Z5H521_9LACO|nr:PLP-dependent aminotransferase family protein [Secundilactobacillus silagincola]GAT18390.1 GntR family transcriptional regulator [Secundilactobacillus silagincola]
MKWQLPGGSQALYIKVITLITDAINNGDLIPGQQLPAERQLAQMLSVNRSTIQQALNELVSNGLLTRKRGSGTWVSMDKWGILTENVNWRMYLAANRFGDPESYLQQLRELESDPQAINLAHFNIPNKMALPVSLNHVSAKQLAKQENHVDISGAADLKQQLVSQLSPLLQHSFSANQLLITSGAQQAFYLITQGLLSYGDAIAIEKPSYFYQLTLFQVAGIRVYGIPLMADGSLDLAYLRQEYYKHRFRFLFVNPNGQNPTGQMMPLAKRRALIRTCQTLKLPIVEDDPFGITDAVSDNQSEPPLKALDPDNVLYIGSLSSLVGNQARIGWLLAPSFIVNQLADIRQQMESGMSIFPQIIASQFLAQPDLQQQIQQQATQLREKRQLLQQALKPFADRDQLSYQLPANGNSFWVHLNTTHPLSVTDYNQFLKQRVLVRPDFLFGSHQNNLRVGFANLSAEQVPQLQERLRSILARL